LNKKSLFPFGIAKTDDFVGRQIDIHKIVKILLKNRLVTIIGLPGIGKSSLCLRIGFFLEERQIQTFRDGVIYLQLRGKNSTQGFVEAIYKYFVT